jgi:hypothetical protein
MDPQGKAVVRGGIDPKRIDSIAAHEEMRQMFNAIGKYHGKAMRRKAIAHVLSHASPTAIAKIGQALQKLGYNPKYPSFNEEVLNYFHTYMTDPVNRARIQAESQSPTKKLMMDRHIKQSWRRMLEAAKNVSHRDLFMYPEKDIKKSIGKNDWQKIVNRHVPSSASVVDHQFHTSNGTGNKTLHDVIHHINVIKPRKKSATEGISQKLVFDHPHLTAEHAPPVMIKPYHKKLEARDHVSLPITGWSTMATKALYNAGGIGHLAEDVTAGEHQGVPLTIHKMAPGFQNIENHYDWYRKLPKGNAHLNPMSVQQVALMDYLANNSDRHVANLMVGSGEGEDGYTPMLAIDHERNFQYNMQPNLARRWGNDEPPTLGDHPSQYMDKTASPGNFIASRMTDYLDPHELASWWQDNGSKIRQEMANQLVAIKDEHVRKHISDNFNKRADLLDQWSQHPSELWKKYNHDEPADEQFPKLYMQKFPRKYKEESAKVMAQLPADPVEAANKILTSSVEMPYKARNKAVLDEVMQDLADKMSPEQLAGFMYDHHSHPLFNVRKMVQNREFKDESEHARFANALRNIADKHPEMKKKFPFLRRIIDKTVR